MNIRRRYLVLCFLCILLTGCDKWEWLSCEPSGDAGSQQDLNIQCDAAIFNNVRVIFSVRSDIEFDEKFDLLASRTAFEDGSRESIILSQLPTSAEMLFTKASNSEYQISIMSPDFVEVFLGRESHGYMILWFKNKQNVFSLKYHVERTCSNREDPDTSTITLDRKKADMKRGETSE